MAYECDGLALLQQLPELVLLPRTTDECARAMRILHREKIAVVGRGAGTGLSGGATPVAGGVLIGTARMRDVLEVNVEDRYARVQAGVVNVDLSLAVEKHALFYAPDPSSQHGLHDRRQRGRELGRAALLQARRDDAPCARDWSSSARTAVCSSSRGRRSIRSATTSWDCSSVAKACSGSRPR
jgi:FAD/FMN-containing dehydrogenase